MTPETEKQTGANANPEYVSAMGKSLL